MWFGRGNPLDMAILRTQGTIKGRIALVTGESRGGGHASALALAAGVATIRALKWLATK
jgi:hypothetical protein